ncbi:MAG: mechanosensitive ion channel family protein [Candidatus Paceibacterota bacterium]
MINYLIILKEFLSLKIGPEFFPISFKIIIIILGVIIFNKILKKIIEKSVRSMVLSNGFQSPEAEKKREDTLINIFTKTIKIVILIVSFVMILQTLGIPVGPILAAAGVVGIALGFGGQYLIRDIITGLFIILENQYRVGDFICSNDKNGLVEDISLRMTTLRDLDGNVHHIPHGEMKIISNLSKNYSRVNLNINVGYSSDLEKVKEVINKVGNDLAEDTIWKNFINKPIQFLRVNNFVDSSIEIKVLGETKPGKQWEVAGEFRFRIKKAFDKEGIDIPFPQRVIHQVKN